jgi:Protein of unknown function (DUF402)
VSPGTRWSPGDVVVLREVWRGRIWTARPANVVRDGDLLMFFVPIGVRWFGPHDDDGRWVNAFVDARRWHIRERIWEGSNVLSFAEPGRPNAILAFWDPGWTFLGWYVNVQTPLERTPAGFDYLDQELDAWIPADGGHWKWKDEDELERSVAAGIWGAADAARFRREAEADVRRVLGREPPFDSDWRGWRPDPSWARPELSPGWDVVDR